MDTIDPSTIHPNAPYQTRCPLGWGYHSPRIAYCWACPVCGGHVIATQAEQTTRIEIATDARCAPCRSTDTPHGADARRPGHA